MALSQREKALILIPVALGALIGFYSFVHEPLMTKRAEAEASLESVERNLKQGQRQLAQEGDLEARRVAVAAREEVVDASVPGKNAAALFVWYLSQAEMRSGGRVKGIKVAERRAVDPADPKKQVQALDCSASASGVSGQASGKAGSGSADGQSTGPAGSGSSGDQAGNGTAANQGAEQNGATGDSSASPPSTSGSAQAAPCSQPLPPGSLIVLSMELKLAGQFGQQLHFTQMLEEMPLFLANDQIALVRPAAPNWQSATDLITDGRPANAYNLLAASPEVEGSYTIQLYFKQAKVGPATNEMTFATEPGKKDPFAQDDVAQFIQYVENAFSGRGYAPNPENPQQWIPTPEQLG